MKTRFLPLALMAVLALAFGAIATACGGSDGGGGELTLEEYFQEVDALVDNVADEVEAIGEEAFTGLDPSFPLEGRIEASRSFFSALAAITATFLDDMRDIDPPAEVEDAHNAFVEAADDYMKTSEDVISQLDEVASQADFDAALAAFFDELGNPEEACLDLQKIADENGIDVSLNCSVE